MTQRTDLPTRRSTRNLDNITHPRACQHLSVSLSTSQHARDLVCLCAASEPHTDVRDEGKKDAPLATMIADEYEFGQSPSYILEEGLPQCIDQRDSPENLMALPQGLIGSHLSVTSRAASSVGDTVGAEAAPPTTGDTETDKSPEPGTSGQSDPSHA